MARRRWVDNVFVERLWRSVKYEVCTCGPTKRPPSFGQDWPATSCALRDDQAPSQRTGPTHPGCGVLRSGSPRFGSLKPEEDFTYHTVQFPGSISDWARYARTTKVRRRKAKRELSSARRECAEAIGRFDEFEAAMDTLRGALECVDIKTGELHRPGHVQALIEGVAQRIESLGVGECAKLAKYLRNRAPGSGAGAKERVAPARGCWPSPGRRRR